jgi:hypothetical protein
MSLNATSIRLMAEKGLSALDIAEIAEAMEVRVDRTAAERQARHREKIKAERDNVTRDVTRDADPSLDKSPQTPKINPTPQAPPRETRARGGSFPCPEGVDAGHWADFLANRKTKRLTNTPTAYRQQIKALTELSDDEWPPGRLVEFAAARGWGAIFDPRNHGHDGRQSGNGRGGQRLAGHQPPDGLSSTTRAAERVFGSLGP